MFYKCDLYTSWMLLTERQHCSLGKSLMPSAVILLPSACSQNGRGVTKVNFTNWCGVDLNIQDECK